MEAIARQPKRKYRHLTEHPKVKAEQEKLDRIRQEIERVRKLVTSENAGFTGFQYDGVRAVKSEDLVERALREDAPTPNERVQEHEREFNRQRRRLEDLERAEPLQVERVNKARREASREWYQEELVHEIAPHVEQLEKALQMIETANAALDEVWQEHKAGLGVDWGAWPEVRFPANDAHKHWPYDGGKLPVWIARWREQVRRHVKV